MATYTPVEAPSISVSVRKDSIYYCSKALGQNRWNGLIRECHWTVKWFKCWATSILTEYPVEGDEEQEPMEMAVRELQKFYSKAW